MTKFGEIIGENRPIFVCFYDTWEVGGEVESILNNVVEILKDKVKVVKVDVNRNPHLANVLRVNEVPAFMIYKNEEMVFRQVGVIPSNVFITLLRNHI